MRRAAIGVPGAAIAALVSLVALPAAGPRNGPFSVNIDSAAIARAIAIGQSADSARQRFHDAYLIPLNDPLLERLEIITEFRRVVLATEDHARMRDSNWGPRQAVEMLQPWRGTIALLLHVTFPPNNAYRAMPPFGLVLYGRPESPDARDRIQPRDLLGTPRYISGQPAPPGTPILAGIVQATFEARRLDPQAVYLAGIALEGKELRRVEVDFDRIE